MTEYIQQHSNFLLLVSFVLGFIGGILIRHRQLKKKEAELEKVVESMYGRNIDRTVRNLKDKEFEETANGNEDKL